MTNTENVRIHWSTHYSFAYSRPTFSAILQEQTYVWFRLYFEHKENWTLSSNKVMATVFFGTRGIIFIDCFKKYYMALLQCLSKEITEKRPHLAKKKKKYSSTMTMHQPTSRRLEVSKIHVLRFELLLHPLYSPDLAPSNYYLFPNLRKWPRGPRFLSNDEVIVTGDGYFEDLMLPVSWNFQSKWTKYVSLNGDYVEK